MKKGDKVYVYEFEKVQIGFFQKTEPEGTMYDVELKNKELEWFSKKCIFPYTDSGRRKLLKQIDKDIKKLQDIKDNIDEY